MVIGTIQGVTPQVIEPKARDLRLIPSTEPMWLSFELKSLYYDESHRRPQKEIRVFVDEYVRPETLRMAYVFFFPFGIDYGICAVLTATATTVSIPCVSAQATI